MGSQAAMENFGRNLSWTPSEIHEPRSETEVLEILARCRGRRIRVVGRLHSWSPTVVAEDVVIDLKYLKDVRVDRRDEQIWVQAGAGCQIKQLLIELDRQADATLPSLGLITEQTIAGAAATATHGSGKNSLSHFIAEFRVAIYDPQTGQPTIRVISGGPELRAARCSLGCLGVVLSVGFWCRPQYQVEEHMRRHRSLDSVLAAVEQFPLQQFFLMPWLWEFIAQHRREVTAPSSRLAWLYRVYFFLAFDLGLHIVVRLLVQCGRRRWTHGFFRRILPWTIVKRWRVVAKSQDMLVMEHELFRHVEAEMFIIQLHIHDALTYTEEILKYFDGDETAISPTTRDRLQQLGLLEKLGQLRGSYTHHYPICVRRVLPDDAMLSMSSGTDQPWYAISFISYDRHERRRAFFEVAEFLARSMAGLFNARPHWGKICPINSSDAGRLYPELADFRDVCTAIDPTGAFRNEWVNQVLFS